MVQRSQHFIKRRAQRNLSMNEIEYVIQYGQVLHRAGALFYYLRKRDIPADDRTNDELTRLIGTAVVISKDRRTLITTWRNRRDGLKKIKRKPKYNLSRACPVRAAVYS